MNAPLKINSPEGSAAIFADAQAGDAKAMRFAALLRAGGIQVERDWEDALNWLALSAKTGHAGAEDELIAICHDQDLMQELTWIVRRGQAFPGDVWYRLRQGIDLKTLLSPPTPELVCPDPFVATAAGMLSPAECDFIRRRIEPFLKPAVISVDGRPGEYEDERRTNTCGVFDLSNTGVPILALRERIAAAHGVYPSQLEPTQVLRYEVGETFVDHLDAFGEDAESQVFMAVSGQRTTTVLVSLNSDYEGGATEFPLLNLRYRGHDGQALLWSNVHADQRRDSRTLHAGRAPTAGVKWMLSQWIRSRDYAG